LLDLAEEILDQMAPLGDLDIAGNADSPVGLGRDHGARAPVVQLGADPVAVDGLVRQQGGEIEILQKRGAPQGRRMKSASQKSEHVLVIPGGLLATRPHADPR
jgi:hypothetical protein